MSIETMRGRLNEAKNNFRKRSKLLASAALTGTAAVACSPGDLTESTFFNIQSYFSGNCTAAIGIQARNFRDIGGVQDQFDQGIDVPLGPVANARVRLAIGSQPPIESTTNKNGAVVKRVNGPCLPGQSRIEVHLLVAAPDGRRVVRDLLVQNGSSQTFPVWLVSESVVATPTVTATPRPNTPTSTRTPDSGRPVATNTPRPETATPTPTPTSTSPGNVETQDQRDYRPFFIGGAVALAAAAVAGGAWWYSNRRP